MKNPTIPNSILALFSRSCVRSHFLSRRDPPFPWEWQRKGEQERTKERTQEWKQGMSGNENGKGKSARKGTAMGKRGHSLSRSHPLIASLPNPASILIPYPFPE